MQDLLSKLSTNPLSLIDNPHEMHTENNIDTLGEGCHSQVFKSNVEKKIIKKFVNSWKSSIKDMWVLYALAVISADEKDIMPWMPNFDAMYINLETKEVWTVMEELTTLKDGIRRRWPESGDDSDGMPISRDVQQQEDLGNFYGQKFTRVQIWNEDLGFEACTDINDRIYAQMITDFLSETFQKFNLPMMFDIHEENIMWRGDQPVISDPLGELPDDDHLNNMYDCIRHYAAKSDRVILIDGTAK
jgi:hypothetical protein